MFLQNLSTSPLQFAAKMTSLLKFETSIFSKYSTSFLQPSEAISALFSVKQRSTVPPQTCWKAQGMQGKHRHKSAHVNAATWAATSSDAATLQQHG
jgi:hypothetical protein